MFKIFVIHDVKAGEYSSLHTCRSVSAAIRQFGGVILGGDNLLSRYPEDYSLVMIGEFDEMTCTLTTCAPEVVQTAVDVLRRADRPRPNGDQLDIVEELNAGR